MTNRLTNDSRNRAAVVAAGAVLALALATGGEARQSQTPPPAGRGARPSRQLAPIPGTPWRIHDERRPHPPAVTPGAAPGAPPSDAVVLFDGHDLSQWVQVAGGATSSTPRRTADGALIPAAWPVRDGYFEVGKGSIVTREAFGDVQLHLEFAEPPPTGGEGQDRGNSGIKFMGLYEVQILDSYDSATYADGQLGAIYGEYPPLVNVARKPGEWQTYDIIFDAPRFDGANLVSPAYVTVILNGVLVQPRRAIMGPTSPTMTPHAYTPTAAELPLLLQDHNFPVRFRNVWIRRLTDPDRPASVSR